MPTDSLDLRAFQSLFNSELEAFFDTKLQAHGRIPNAPLFLEALSHTRKLLLSGGKRIRPYMCYLAYCSEGGVEQKESIRAGIALELFHMFALVHDDIIDRGFTRHGVPTTHVFVSEKLAGIDGRDISHIADSIALLIGDLIFSWSYEIIGSLDNTEVAQIFNQMVSEVVAGQALDVSFMVENTVSMSDILKKNELKTARYTFVNPMQIGRALAQSTQHIDTYTDFGLTLGQAFQMQDDLLDVVGTTAVTGKEPFIDIEDRQHTLLTQYVFDHAEAKDRHVLESFFGKKLSSSDRVVLAKLFADTGAISYAQGEIGTLLDHASLYSTQLSNKQDSQWNTIVGLLRGRVA